MLFLVFFNGNIFRPKVDLESIKMTDFFSNQHYVRGFSELGIDLQLISRIEMPQAWASQIKRAGYLPLYICKLLNVMYMYKIE